MNPYSGKVICKRCYGTAYCPTAVTGHEDKKDFQYIKQTENFGGKIKREQEIILFI